MKTKRTSPIETLREFLDCADWYGRIPSAKNNDLPGERKMAFWLIHFKQAKKGKSTCKWDPALQEMAEREGLPQLFDVDSRMIKNFDLTGKKIGDLKVIGKAQKFSEFGQTMWICRKHGKLVAANSFDLRRMEVDADYPRIKEEAQHLVGRQLGVWKLLGIYGSDENETTWFCSNLNDPSILKKMTFPPIPVLDNYFNAIAGNVDEYLDSSIGIKVSNLAGQKFGRWTVMGYSHKAVNSECVWTCLCDCGNIGKVAGGKLRAGSSLSCGCFRKDYLSKAVHERLASAVAS